MKGKTYIFTCTLRGKHMTFSTFQPNEKFAWDWFKSTHKYARNVICKEG